METITIKPVQVSAHYDAISEMMRGLHEHEKTLNNKTADWRDIEQSYMRHVINMQEDGEGLFLIAYSGNQPAGFIFGYTEEPGDSRIEQYTGKELYVSDGYVCPEFRRRGIYKQLNSRLEAHFIGMGIRRITRYTMCNNSNMRSFLEQEGYHNTRVVYEKWL